MDGFDYDYELTKIKILFIMIFPTQIKKIEK